MHLKPALYRIISRAGDDFARLQDFPYIFRRQLKPRGSADCERDAVAKIDDALSPAAAGVAICWKMRARYIH